MKVYIAKHYWKDGENATWECHEKVDKEVFEYLKENYHNFVKDRKSEVEKNGYFIYPCYEDAKDIFGRDITNVTFFVSKEKVKTSLCDKTYENLELKIKTKKNNTSMLVGAIALIAIVFFSMTFLNKSKAHNNQTVARETSEKSKIQNYNSLIDNWNQQVQNLTKKKKFLLVRDDNQKLIKQLNSFVKPFYNTPKTESDKYKKYLNDNHSDKNITFQKEMDKAKLKEGLKTITNERSMSEIVKKVLMMNDIDIFYPYINK
jgi:hypothetical protein